MGNRSRTSILTRKGAVGKIALGAASFMLLTVVGSATIAGATPVPTTTKPGDMTSLNKGKEKENDKDNNGHHNDKDHGKDNEKDHGKNHGDHGYGGQNNSISTNLNVNQSGHDNVLTIIFNYIFG